MKICIMTRGREGKQETAKHVPPERFNDLVLVCPRGERHPYQKVYAPDSVTNYSQKMQWILYDIFPNDEKILIMDDDLYFNEYYHDGKLYIMEDKEHLRLMFKNIETLMDHYALVGMHPRMMFNHAKEYYEENSKIVTVQGINRKFIPSGLKIDQFPILADVVLNCTLLSRGISNARLTTHSVDWLQSQTATGGCSYRTPEMQREATAWIAEKFGPFAKQVQRTPKKVIWLENTRYDLHIRWKDMYEHGSKKYGTEYQRRTPTLDPRTLRYSFGERLGPKAKAMDL